MSNLTNNTTATTAAATTSRFSWRHVEFSLCPFPEGEPGYDQGWSYNQDRGEWSSGGQVLAGNSREPERGGSIGVTFRVTSGGEEPEAPDYDDWDDLLDVYDEVVNINRLAGHRPGAWLLPDGRVVPNKKEMQRRLLRTIRHLDEPGVDIAYEAIRLDGYGDEDGHRLLKLKIYSFLWLDGNLLPYIDAGNVIYW